MSTMKQPPAGPKGSGSAVGNETQADMTGAFEMGRGTSLKGAMKELHDQHPHHYADGGIHGTTDHIRHEPMHGMLKRK
jgi:hypothetical protein